MAASEANLGNPRLTEIEQRDIEEITGLVRRGAQIEAQVRRRRDGVHHDLIRWMRNYAAQHQDISPEALLRVATRLYSPATQTADVADAPGRENPGPLGGIPG